MNRDARPGHDAKRRKLVAAGLLLSVTVCTASWAALASIPPKPRPGKKPADSYNVRNGWLLADTDH